MPVLALAKPLLDVTSSVHRPDAKSMVSLRQPRNLDLPSRCNRHVGGDSGGSPVLLDAVVSPVEQAPLKDAARLVRFELERVVTGVVYWDTPLAIIRLAELCDG